MNLSPVRALSIHLAGFQNREPACHGGAAYPYRPLAHVVNQGDSWRTVVGAHLIN